MSVAIRLSRGGAKKRPYYKIVVIDSRTARDGKFIERIGSYNPMLPKESEERIKIDADRARHWLSVGAQPSDRVARFLDAAGVKERVAKVNAKKGEPGEKAKERATERAERDEAAAAAAAEAAAAPAPEPEEAVPTEADAAPAAEPEQAAAEVEPAAATEPEQTSAAVPEPTPTAEPEQAPAVEPEAIAAAETEQVPGSDTATENATNQGQSADEPAEGGDDQTPAEGAEKAE